MSSVEGVVLSPFGWFPGVVALSLRSDVGWSWGGVQRPPALPPDSKSMRTWGEETVPSLHLKEFFSILSTQCVREWK